ncbi:RNase P modulator RnpM [Fervidibacillus albus]|uniref:YlxR family protein n=1 Tax=Fervidibacillus albus TaxID=2980026 RepID=A0A9E8LW19_9BACI|nr:YlxR family protein [Fervidibacillus albus]WAA10753.1 YlxR family protein [Fervidibacillus albus]
MTRQKKIPMRKCVATGEMLPKKEMIRIVRSKDGEVSIDPTGKKSGRGAYLSKKKDAIVLAKRKNILEKHLQVKIDESIYDEIIHFIEKEPTV